MDTLNTPDHPAGNDADGNPPRQEQTDAQRRQQQQAREQERRDRDAAGRGEQQK